MIELSAFFSNKELYATNNLPLGVSNNRTNPRPLDSSSVKKSYDELIDYIDNGAAYPGQPVVVVNDDVLSSFIINDKGLPIYYKDYETSKSELTQEFTDKFYNEKYFPEHSLKADSTGKIYKLILNNEVATLINTSQSGSSFGTVYSLYTSKIVPELVLMGAENGTFYSLDAGKTFKLLGFSGNYGPATSFYESPILIKTFADEPTKQDGLKYKIEFICTLRGEGFFNPEVGYFCFYLTADKLIVLKSVDGGVIEYPPCMYLFQLAMDADALTTATINLITPSITNTYKFKQAYNLIYDVVNDRDISNTISSIYDIVFWKYDLDLEQNTFAIACDTGIHLLCNSGVVKLSPAISYTLLRHNNYIFLEALLLKKIVAFDFDYTGLYGVYTLPTDINNVNKLKLVGEYIVAITLSSYILISKDALTWQPIRITTNTNDLNIDDICCQYNGMGKYTYYLVTNKIASSSPLVYSDDNTGIYRSNDLLTWELFDNITISSKAGTIVHDKLLVGSDQGISIYKHILTDILTRDEFDPDPIFTDKYVYNTYIDVDKVGTTAKYVGFIVKDNLLLTHSKIHSITVTCLNQNTETVKMKIGDADKNNPTNTNVVRGESINSVIMSEPGKSYTFYFNDISLTPENYVMAFFETLSGNRSLQSIVHNNKEIGWLSDNRAWTANKSPRVIINHTVEPDVTNVNFIILKDKTADHRYKLYIDGGVLKTEVIE